jgi:2-polyprenyl-6-methoxyphenol hydroxylase-like FAD-dependent oxidoreductase
MPQWDFLDFLAERAKRYPCFRLLMSAEVDGLIEEEGSVAGVAAKTKDGQLTIRADLTVGADGRHSSVRREAGFVPLDIGAPRMRFGSSFRAGPPMPTTFSAESTPARSWLCSTAANIGSAPM